MIGGPSVNTQAQQAQQQNQLQGEQYAAQQQAAAQKQLAAYEQANPNPQSQAQPLQSPAAFSPSTMGGGSFTGGRANPASPQPGQVAPQNPGQGAPTAATQGQISPQLMAMLRQALAQKQG